MDGRNRFGLGELGDNTSDGSEQFLSNSGQWSGRQIIIQLWSIQTLRLHFIETIHAARARNGGEKALLEGQGSGLQK